MLLKFNWRTLLYTNLQEDAVLEIHSFKTRDQNSISRACFSFCLHSHSSKVTFVCHVFALLWNTLFTMRYLFRNGMTLLRFFMYVERGQFTQNQYWHHLIIFNDFLSSVEHKTRYFDNGGQRSPNGYQHSSKYFHLCFAEDGRSYSFGTTLG